MTMLSQNDRKFPKFLFKILKQSLYLIIPVKWRMRRQYWKLKNFLEDAQWWDQREIEYWQLAKLRKIISYAFDNVPGYNFLYKDAGIKPDDITSLSDVNLLPFTTKELLRDNLDDFTAKNIPLSKLRYVTTGGSTGIPFGFYHTTTNGWMETAFMHSGWERVGWQLSGKSAVLRGAFIGSDDCFWKYDRANRLLHLSSYYLTKRTYQKFVGKLEEIQPIYLQAYPSAATIFADLLLDHHDIGRINFDVILLGSENIYEWQKDKLRQAFPSAKLFSWYGHMEQVILSPWCETEETYHVWPFYGLIEILDKNCKVEVGQIGEIIGTSFWNYATPFIRYRTMDRARYDANLCKQCGRSFMTLNPIEGRLQEMIISASGRYISMTAINFHSNVFDKVRQFQFYQDRPGKVILRVVRKIHFKDDEKVFIYQELKKKLGSDMELEIDYVDKITKTRQGKHRFLIQKLDVKYGD